MGHTSNIIWIGKYDHTLKNNKGIIWSNGKSFSHDNISEYVKDAKQVLDYNAVNGIETTRIAAQHPNTIFYGHITDQDNLVKAIEGVWVPQYDTTPGNQYHADFDKSFTYTEWKTKDNTKESEIRRKEGIDNIKFLQGDQNGNYTNRFDTILAFNSGIEDNVSELAKVMNMLNEKGVLVTDKLELTKKEYNEIIFDPEKTYDGNLQLPKIHLENKLFQDKSPVMNAYKNVQN